VAKKKDAWAGKWQLYAGDEGEGKAYLKPGVFRLRAVRYPRRGGAVAFYQLTVVRGMHKCWKKNIRLFPRGSHCCRKAGKLLPVWTEECDSDWSSAATQLRGTFGLPNGSIPGINPRLERLEGDIRPKKKYAEALTIVRVGLAVEDKTDLLIFILKSFNKPKGKGAKWSFLEDGTAHGGNPH
jgi:hypothetical protein